MSSVRMQMNDHLKPALKLLLVISLFTIVDYFFHLIPYLHVPQPHYSIAKFLYGSILGCVAYLLLKWYNYSNYDLKPYLNALILASFIILPLQIRYAFIYSYGIIWNIAVISLHFAILFPLAYFILDWDD